LAPDQAAGRPTVYAWFPARFGSWDTDTVRWDLLTHICFRSVELRADGSLHEPLGPAADPAIERLVQTAHRHGVKVTVLVWVDSRADSDGYLANAPERAAANLLAYVRRHNLDGVNIDDEKMHEFNQAAGRPNRELLTSFFRILNQTFKSTNPEYHLSFATAPVISRNDRFATAWPDYAAIAHLVDAIIPMGYTMNPPAIGWTTSAEPLAGGGKAAHTTTRDMQTMVEDYLAALGGQRRKLLVGVSLDFGGHEWRCRTDQPLSPTLDRGARRSIAECEAAARTHGRRWHEQQAAPWYVFPEGPGFIQGWYLDLPAWQTRLRWIRDQQVGGIGVWVLDGKADPPERWQALQSLR
jgi:spore germination protein YaaH